MSVWSSVLTELALGSVANRVITSFKLYVLADLVSSIYLPIGSRENICKKTSPGFKVGWTYPSLGAWISKLKKLVDS